ncbi:glutathione S-transferase [Escherichia coli]|nr:glutathione S-transferase [Escherichia coli]
MSILRLRLVALNGRSDATVTNGAIVIHTQRLKSDPGGNLLS